MQRFVMRTANKYNSNSQIHALKSIFSTSCQPSIIRISHRITEGVLFVIIHAGVANWMRHELRKPTRPFTSGTSDDPDSIDDDFVERYEEALQCQPVEQRSFIDLAYQYVLSSCYHVLQSLSVFFSSPPSSLFAHV